MPRTPTKRAKRAVAQILERAENPEEVLLAVAEDLEQAEVEATEPRVPGKVVHGQKTSWTLGDIEKIFPVVEFTPDDTVNITWNGVSKQLIAGVSQLMPTCFRDLYLETKRRTRAKKDIVVSTGKIQVDIGAGAFE